MVTDKNWLGHLFQKSVEDSGIRFLRVNYYIVLDSELCVLFAYVYPKCTWTQPCFFLVKKALITRKALLYSSIS